MTNTSLAEGSEIASLLPKPGRTYEDEQRLQHLDLSSLTVDRLWAEKQLLTAALARMIFDESRVWLWCGPEPIAASDWTRDRIRRLDTELVRRKARS